MDSSYYKNVIQLGLTHGIAFVVNMLTKYYLLNPENKKIIYLVEGFVKFILRQKGIIIIKKKLLIKYSKFSRTFFEKKESIDMLRFIENGIKINTFKINKTMIGIDTLQDYRNFIKKT